MEVNRLKADFEKELPSASWPYVRNTSVAQYQARIVLESHQASWLYYVPAGKSMTVLHVTPDMTESVLLKIDAKETDQRGQLYVQLNVEPEGSMVNLFGPQSLIATFKANRDSKIIIDDDSESVSSTMPNREIFKTSAGNPRFWRPHAAKALECSSTESIVLCKWFEQETDAKMLLIERNHALKIICK